MVSRNFRVVLQLAVSLGLLALLVSRVDWSRSLPLVARASPWLVLALLVIYAADRVLMALKWRQLLRVLDPRLGPLGAVRVYYESTFVGFAMPLGGLGPDIVRYVRLTKLGIAPHVTLVSMGMERLVGFVATILLAAVGLAVLSTLVSGSALGNFAAAATACALAAAALAAAALFHPRAIDAGERLIARSRRIARRAKKYLDSARAFASRRRLLVLNLGLSIVEQTTPVWTYWIGSRALDTPFSLAACLAVAPVTIVIQRLPISYGGLGLREGSAAALLVALGYDYSEVLIVLMMLFVVFVVSLLPGAVIFKRSPKLADTPTPRAAR